MGVNSGREQWARVPGTPELWASDGGQIATLKYDGAGFRYLTLKMDEGGEMYVSFRRGENKKMGPRKVAALVLAACGRPSVGGTALIFRAGAPEIRPPHSFSAAREVHPAASLAPLDGAAANKLAHYRLRRESTRGDERAPTRTAADIPRSQRAAPSPITRDVLSRRCAHDSVRQSRRSHRQTRHPRLMAHSLPPKAHS